MQELKVCPRCRGAIPSLERINQHPGALSRTDNHTEVCSQCGLEEALEWHAGTLSDKAVWPLDRGRDVILKWW